MKLFRYIFLFVLLLSSFSANAQKKDDEFKEKIVLGVSGGATMSRFFFVPSVRLRTLTDMTAGITFRYDVESYASMQIELNYLKTGWRERYELENGDINPNITYTRSLSYISMPWLTYLHFGYDNLQAFIVGGPEIAYQIAEKSIETGRDMLNANAIARHDMPTTNKFYWGLSGGLGISYRFLSKNLIELEGRYSYGFEDIWSTKRVDPYGQASPSIITAKLSYLFEF